MRHSVIPKKASLVGAFFVSLLCAGQAQAFCPQRADLAQVAVRQVVDGDTVRLVDGRSIRLIGINTPELGRKGRSDEPYAVQAKRRLQALVDASDGRVGLLYGAQLKDRYGRTLAHLYDRQGRNLEAQLLGEGLGFMVAVVPNSALVTCQAQAERQARSKRLGVWRDEQAKTAGQLRSGGFALLGGRVTSVQRNRGGLWIDLDGGRVLRVAPELLGEFDVRALQELKGRQVQARGWVIDRQSRGGLKSGQARWMLPLTHSAMLEVLP
ncbi:thermonuclease family protein [Pseudomonas sp. o96-267]|uniref:thermonuclease family protein n=1 Tax=Pseudomonas sp. o96-267 TaxID=2479853 RepID=UPI000F7A3F3D|nr:thermonuclease family protein [Pseudomonas sp. o96-267]RRV29081.1 thermonuclease family protein [Pseudomonas sp. o96-267]